jgi:GNAT superfamily N-acetyltransferase
MVDIQQVGTFEATDAVDLNDALGGMSIKPVEETITFEKTVNESEATTDEDAVETLTSTTTATEDAISEGTNTIRYENVWKMANEKARTGAMQLWEDETNGTMPKKMQEARADLLAVVAYDGENVIAVSTLQTELNRGLWCRIGYFRCIVRSEYRKKGVATELLQECYKLLSEYSKENSGEKIHALAVSIDKKLCPERAAKPVWPEVGTGMTLCGYNEHGMQIRLAWFEHVQLQY